MSLKKFFKEKNFGFYVTLVVSILLIVTGIVYSSMFKGTRDFSLWTTILPIAGGVLSLVLALLNQTKFAHYVLHVFALLALLVFINGIYLFISEVFTGIDFEESLVVPAKIAIGLFVTGYVISFANCFFPQVRKNKSSEEVEADE